MQRRKLLGRWGQCLLELPRRLLLPGTGLDGVLFLRGGLLPAHVWELRLSEQMRSGLLLDRHWCRRIVRMHGLCLGDVCVSGGGGLMHDLWFGQLPVSDGGNFLHSLPARILPSGCPPLPTFYPNCRFSVVCLLK